MSKEASVFNVGTVPELKPVETLFPLTTWYCKIGVNSSALKSSKLDAPKSLNKVAKASLVGAKTVKGPVALNASTKLAFTTADTKVLKAGLLIAVLTTLGGNNTLSMMWITPLEAATSAVVTLVVEFKLTPESVLTNKLTFVLLGPSLKVGTYPLLKALERTSPLTTWYNKMGVNCSADNSSKLLTPKSLNKAVKASLVGANTVKGPSPANVPARFALVSAATSVLNCVSPEAMSTIVSETGGSIGLSSSSLSHDTAKKDRVNKTNNILKLGNNLNIVCGFDCLKIMKLQPKPF